MPFPSTFSGTLGIKVEDQDVRWEYGDATFDFILRFKNIVAKVRLQNDSLSGIYSFGETMGFDVHFNKYGFPHDIEYDFVSEIEMISEHQPPKEGEYLELSEESLYGPVDIPLKVKEPDVP